MSIHSYRLPMMPYHLADNLAQLSPSDAVMLMWFYGLDAIEQEGRPEEHSQPSPVIVLGDDQLLPLGPTIEIGVFYGGSLWFAAQRAKLLGQAAWGLDEFGRDGSKFQGEPTLLLAAGQMVAEGLHQHVRLCVGNTKDKSHDQYAVELTGDEAEGMPSGYRLIRATKRRTPIRDEAFAGVFTGADHSGRWALSDIPWCDRVCMPGGYIAVHAMHGTANKPSDKYDDPRLNAPDGRPYERVVRDLAEEFGWVSIARMVGSSVEVYRKPEEG